MISELRQFILNHLRNKTSLTPNYYVHITDKWLVYPHELEALTIEEVGEHMGNEIATLITDAINISDQKQEESDYT